MGKFRIRMKWDAFELEVDGSREDIPLIGQQIGKQLSGVIAPSIGIANEDKDDEPLIAGGAGE